MGTTFRGILIQVAPSGVPIATLRSLREALTGRRTEGILHVKENASRPLAKV